MRYLVFDKENSHKIWVKVEGGTWGLDLYLPDMHRYELRAASLRSSELSCHSG